AVYLHDFSSGGDVSVGSVRRWSLDLLGEDVGNRQSLAEARRARKARDPSAHGSSVNGDLEALAASGRSAKPPQSERARDGVILHAQEKRHFRGHFFPLASRIRNDQDGAAPSLASAWASSSGSISTT